MVPRAAVAALLFVAATALAKPLFVPTVPPRPFAQGKLWGYRDARGRVIIPPRFRRAEAFVAGGHIAPVVDGDGLAWIDRRGEVLARPFVFDNGADPFAGGYTRIVDAAQRLGFMDEIGWIAIPPRFAFVRPFVDERAAFCEGCRAVKDGEHARVVGGAWGFIDRHGTVVVAASYDEVEDFRRGQARVRLGTTWSNIDRTGHLPSQSLQRKK